MGVEREDFPDDDPAGTVDENDAKSAQARLNWIRSSGRSDVAKKLRRQRRHLHLHLYLQHHHHRQHHHHHHATA